MQDHVKCGCDICGTGFFVPVEVLQEVNEQINCPVCLEPAQVDGHDEQTFDDWNEDWEDDEEDPPGVGAELVGR